MSLQQLIGQIESHEFAIHTNVVSGTGQFFRAIAEQVPANQLRSEIKSPTLARELVIRISKLSRQRVDIRYENPFDTAFATYLWALQSVHPPLARIAAEGIVQAPNCFWSSRLAESILRETFAVGSGSTLVEKEGCKHTELFATREAGENQILADLAVSFLSQSEGWLFKGSPTSSVSASSKEEFKTGLATQIGMYESPIDVRVEAGASGDCVTEVKLAA
jgi:hypothetical protein